MGAMSKREYDSLIRKRCSHPESEWELCPHDWSYHVTCGTYVTEKGKTTARKFRGPIPDARSYDDAKKKYASIAANIRNGRPALHGLAQPCEAMTVQQGVVDWLAHTRGRKDSTIQMYRDLWRKHLTPVIGQLPITAPTIDDLERLHRGLDAKLSESTRQKIAIALQAFFKFAKGRKWRTDHPAEGLAGQVRDPDASPDDLVIDPARDRDKYFTADEAAHLIAIVERTHAQWYVFILTAFQTGMRMGELAALRYGAINWRGLYITVRSNWVRGKFTTPKNGTSRSVVIDRRLAMLLRARRRFRRDRSCDLVFPVRDGKPCETGDPIDVRHFRRRVWTTLLDAADFDQRTPKAMRHTHTTLLLMAGKPIAWVAAQAGRSIRETERTYFHFLPSTAQSGAEDLAALLTKTHVSGMGARTATKRTSSAAKLRVVAQK
jgi:integrase